jgi:hypothetical protein
MTNEQLHDGNCITMAVPSAAAVTAGMPLLFGRGACPAMGLAGVAVNAYTPPTGTPTGNVGVKFVGVYFLEVIADDSGAVTLAPGDKIYATGGTYHLATGCLYGFTLTAEKDTGAYFGNVLDAVSSGATATVRVRLKVAGA